MIDETIFDVAIERQSLWVELVDGRRISVPLAWLPKLQAAGPVRCGDAIVGEGGHSVRWPAIGEVITIERVLGRRRFCGSGSGVKIADIEAVKTGRAKVGENGK